MPRLKRQVGIRASRAWLLALALDVLFAGPARARCLVTVDELVGLAINPQVRTARARRYAAAHSVNHGCAPADPTFSFGNMRARPQASTTPRSMRCS